MPEFYLQSHFPLKGKLNFLFNKNGKYKRNFAVLGVPKIPQYAIVANELGMSGSQLQGFVNLTSNMHQVSACPVSFFGAA